MQDDSQGVYGGWDVVADLDEKTQTMLYTRSGRNDRAAMLEGMDAQQRYDLMAYMLGDNINYFQNIEDQLYYFERSALWGLANGSYMSWADAFVIMVILDGFLVNEGVFSISSLYNANAHGYTTAVVGWRNFFDELNSARADGLDADELAILNNLWGIAEQAGVNYAVSRTDYLISNGTVSPLTVDQQFVADGFVWAGNLYRTWVTNGWSLIADLRRDGSVFGAINRGWTYYGAFGITSIMRAAAGEYSHRVRISQCPGCYYYD